MSIVPQIGERFGSLTVTEMLGKQECGKEKRDCVRVKCDCGTEKVAQSRLLKNGRTRSCGCLVAASCALRNQSNSEPIVIGGKYGKFTVLENLGSQQSGTARKELVRVRCECGTEKVLRSGSLKNGHIKSCGCLKTDAYTRKDNYDATLLHPGEKFGKLIVLENLGTLQSGNVRVNCVRVRCECGTEKIVQSKLLKMGHTKSCGCLLASGDNHRKHDGSKTRLFRIWAMMRERCSNPETKRYGGRGILVCPEWSDFTVFRKWAEANGYDETLTIDRKNNDGNYEPDNCRWATKAQQSRNTCRNINITAFGETKTAADWAIDPRCSINEGSLIARIRKGMPPEEAITSPSWLATLS